MLQKVYFCSRKTCLSSSIPYHQKCTAITEFSYQLGESTVSNMISETIEGIYQCLKKDYLNPPQTPEEWQKIADQFKENWNKPNIIDITDSKHIRIECPKLSVTQYCNYEGFYSIVLLVICDTNYCLTLFNLGQFGSNKESGVLVNSELFEQNRLNLPVEANLIINDAPYFLLGDEIFPLKKNG